MNAQELSNLYDFRGKTAVITGGTGLLGGEMACALVGLGANVAVLDRNTAIPEAHRQPLAAGPGKYLVVYADVLQRKLLEQAVAEVLAAFGRIDILINAAGGNHPQATTAADSSFFDLLPESLGFVFDLNILGTILPSQVVGKVMAEQGTGVILNISSMNALRPLTRIPAYSAAKAGVSNFTQWLAVHLAQEYSPQIRVNAVAPGFFVSKQNHTLLYRRRQPDPARPTNHRSYADGAIWHGGRAAGHRALAAFAGVPIRHRHRRPCGRRFFRLQRRLIIGEGMLAQTFSTHGTLSPDQVRQTVAAGLENRFTGQKAAGFDPDHTRSIPLPFLFRELVTLLHDGAARFYGRAGDASAAGMQNSC
jgi:NAD(P)-dependent dehydrogenase (short-subunit alcohol dehydrogenase family)